MMNWWLFFPELSVLVVAVVFLALSWQRRPDPRRDYLIAVALAAVVMGVSLSGVRLTGDLFHDVYRLDLFSQVFKVLLAIGFFLAVFLCEKLEGVAPAHHAEFYLLLALCTLAMMMLVSSVHLLTLYMALELSSYSLYVLVLLRRQAHLGMPGGLRYFLVGVCASALMLFGIALIYGATGKAAIGELIPELSGLMTRPAVVFGLVLTLGGLFFKLAVFPFHFWAPDAYEAAPNQATAYIATASKVAAVAILLRLVMPVHDAGPLLARTLAALAIISMTVGNLAAIGQKDFKRLMAFSSTAHAGYLLVGILTMTADGAAAVIFYAAAVLVMKFTCFLVMVRVATDGRNLQIAELAGLHRRAPLLAVALMMALFSLAGIPPTIGFTGKLLIFAAAVHQGYLVLVLIAMANVVVSLYYYLMVLKAAYLDEPAAPPPAMDVPAAFQIAAVAMVLIIVAAGFYPAPLIDLARAAARVLV